MPAHASDCVRRGCKNLIVRERDGFLWDGRPQHFITIECKAHPSASSSGPYDSLDEISHGFSCPIPEINKQLSLF